MTDRVRALSGQFHMLPPDAVVLCAVSGGADSMCLLHLLHSLSKQCRFSVQCAHFNHNLRGDESDRDEAFVRDWCLEKEIPFVCGSADVAAESERTGRGIEETARILRYEFLERAAKQVGASRIATAHTADDNAETMLLNLVRGTGLQGLGAIPPRRGIVVRPLLNVTRAQVEEYCTEHAVPYVEDSSNADDAYTRNFLRHQVIPLLRQVNPRAAEHMSAAAQRVREDHEYLNELAEQLAADACMTDHGLEIGAERLAAAPQSAAVRAARLLLERSGGGKNCTAAHLDAVVALSRNNSPSAAVDLPGIKVRRQYGKLVFQPAGEEEDLPPPTPIRTDAAVSYGETGWTVRCRKVVCPAPEEQKKEAIYLSQSGLCGTPVLRERRTGDEIKLPGRGTKSIKKLFIEEKIPLPQRKMIPVLADEKGVLAVGALGADVSRLAAPGEDSLEVILQKE